MTRISDVMSTGLVTIGRSTTVREAAGLMVRHGVGALLVMEGSALVGIFTERDISRAVMRDVADLGRSSPVARWMTPHPMIAFPQMTAEAALELMEVHGFRHLPVTSGDQVMGIVSMRDLVIAGSLEHAEPK